MKKLTQAVFDGAPDWVKSAAVDADGECYWYSLDGYDLRLQPDWWEYKHIDGATCDYVGDGFDASDWMHSAIDRGSEATNKEKLESLVSDINNNIDFLVDAFSKDTGISVNDVYVELSVECYDSSLDE